MQLTAGLNEEGECVLTDQDDVSWKLWQVRMNALEKTLFDDLLQRRKPNCRQWEISVSAAASLQGQFPQSRVPVVPVATVPQCNPLRYPGGKTWLVPHIREWLWHTKPKILIEPFAGGTLVSLTAVMEELAKSAVIIEIDRDVVDFWRSALECGTILQERGKRQGHLVKMVSEMLANRISKIQECADRPSFFKGDGMKMLPILLRGWSRDAAVFIDPPYTASGGKMAGSRLYKRSKINHAALFKILAKHKSNFLMTYDAAPEIVNLTNKHGFSAAVVSMKNGHHNQLVELVTPPKPLFA